MTYNEWCEYAQFGQTCEYDNQILQFVEQYNNAKHQQFLNQIDNDRANRSVQRTNNFWVVQLNFTKDPTTKKYILQCYDGSTWVWTSYDSESKGLIRDFDEIISQYTEL